MKAFTIFTSLFMLSQSLVAQFINNAGMNIHNSALITTNGDWLNDASTHILNNGVISTSESFINSGTLDESSAGGFTLRYETDLTFLPGGSRMGYLVKEGSATLILDRTITLKDSLILSGGIIQLSNADDTVALSAGAVLDNGPGSWIEGGYISRSGQGDLTFPFGKDGLYLPLKLHKVNALKATASILEAPAFHTAGPGVDALIGFPYAWKVVGKDPSDTAAYVEVSYPNSLPVVSNPIVVREIAGQEYASMGARHIGNSDGQITVRSYSRRLNGLFTVAQGFPSDWETDSLALVALYQSTGGPQWIDNTNWLSGMVETWFGVTMNGQSVTSVELPANNLTGSLADPLVDILSLQVVNLSRNEITSIPDFTLNPEITSLNVSDNNLDFTTLEPNASVLGINYLIQHSIGSQYDLQLPVGAHHEFSVPDQGPNSVYEWRRNGQVVADATGPVFVVPSIGRETMGEYDVEITNPNLPGLTLKSATQKVLAYANLTGVLLAQPQVPAQRGQMTLYKIQPGAFEPLSTVLTADDGVYTFEKVILDDYQIRGFADTLLHARALPTYYNSTIFWEEADTLEVFDNVTGLDILSQVEPAPPSGRGAISGFFEEDDGTGRVHDIEKPKRIAKAGVCARRVERTGRTKDEILVLVAYVFTNENGEFTLPNLPTGEYRLNFQYPGYPMDETSYTTITIGTAFESQVMVEARVIDGKINVQKMTITGLYEDATYRASVYPNPASEFIELEFPGEEPGRSVAISDLQGRTMLKTDAPGKALSIDVRNFGLGVYIMHINENGRNVKTLKIAIE